MEEKIFLKKYQTENALLQLQSDFENGKIVESELLEEEKIALAELYLNQIEELEAKAAFYEKSLENYKNKIIEKRERIKLS